MKQYFANMHIWLAVIVAAASGLTYRNTFNDKTNSPIISYSVYSVGRDMVSIWASPLLLGSYTGSLRVDITGPTYLNNSISSSESIQEWIETNPSFPIAKDQVYYYCDQTDGNDVCLVKIAKIGLVNIGVSDYIGGDVDITLF